VRFRSRDDEAARLQSFVLADPIGVVGAGVGGDGVDIAAVQRVDATFDQALFLAGATSLFSDVRAALSAGSIDPVAGRLSPELTAMLGKQLQYATTAGHQLTMTSIDEVTAILRGVEADSTGTIVCLVRYNVVGRMGLVALGGTVPPASQPIPKPSALMVPPPRMSLGAHPWCSSECGSCRRQPANETGGPR